MHHIEGGSYPVSCIQDAVRQSPTNANTQVEEGFLDFETWA
jgi:hypothetical protein